MRTWIFGFGILFFVVSISVSFVACGKSKSEEAFTAQPISQAQDQKDARQAGGVTQAPAATASVPVTPKGELTGSYFGNHLVLVHPHPAHFGTLRIEGEDARILFHMMGAKSKKTEANATWLQGSVRNGLDMSCYKLIKKETPKVPEYSCTVYLNYQQGTVNRQIPKINARKKVPHLLSTYVGQNLMLVVGQSKPLGIISIQGTDAEVLYKTLQLKAASDESKMKMGKQLVCFETHPEPALNSAPLKTNYSCQIHLNYRMGRALAQKEPR